MDPVKAIEPRSPVIGLSAFAVLVLAKLCMVSGQNVPISLALFIDDAVIGLCFCLGEWFCPRARWILRIIYFALVAYAAFNVPVARLTSSPLTMPMLRATGSALSDSIAHHLTRTNVAFIALILVVAGLLPRLAASIPTWTRNLCGLALAVYASCGLSLDAAGLRPNALFTLARSTQPQLRARAVEADFRASLFPPVDRGVDSSSWAGAAAGRNIVLIALESTGAQYLRLYGATNDPMPNLTQFAQKSLLFENASAVYPESIKGLFSVLCSRYPAFDTQSSDYAKVHTPALSDVARAQGYRTALFHSGRFMYLGMRDIIDNRGFEVLEDAGNIGGDHESSFGVDEPSAVRRLLSWVDSLNSGEPFCAFYLPIAGHHPYEVPHDGSFRDPDERSRYLNALHYADTALGDLFRGLAARGVDTNTLFVIYGDHGEAFAQHPANFGHTFFLFEENVHVPLVFVAPGLFDMQTRIPLPVSLIDVTPTVAALVGFPPTPDWQGVSLLDGRPGISLFFTDYGLPLVGLRDGKWKFICEVNSSRAQLYDLSADPSEEKDVASAHPDLVRACRQRLLAWAATQKSLLRP